MKQTFIYLPCLFFMFFAQSLSAQFSAGASLVYGADLEDLGIQVKGLYQINDTWRGTADLIFYFDGVEDLNVTEINLNANYLFGDMESVAPYALAGLNILRVGTSFDGTSFSVSEVGINIGGGVNFPISEALVGAAELKYAIGDADQLVIGAGVVFSF